MTDWRLAEALAIERRYGSSAALWVSMRRGALMLAGDAEGVERMGAVAAKLDGLLAGRLTS